MLDELFEVFAWVALTYAVWAGVTAFTAGGRTLLELINPNRNFFLLFAVGVSLLAYSCLRQAGLQTGRGRWQLLAELVNEHKAHPAVIVAAACLVFSVVLVGVVLYCRWCLPRSPETFAAADSNKVDVECGRALRHYVRWTGGLDYAVAFEFRGGELLPPTEAGDERDILRGLPPSGEAGPARPAPRSRARRLARRLLGLVRTPALAPAEEKAVALQTEKWQTLARELFARWRGENEVLAKAAQGAAVRMSYDLACGAVYAELFFFPHDRTAGLFVFGATLDQKEASALVAARHFDLLTSALRRIWRAGGRG